MTIHWKALEEHFLMVPLLVLLPGFQKGRDIKLLKEMVRMSDSQPEGLGFESRPRHGVVSVSRIP
jgi:hypothetical protein